MNLKPIIPLENEGLKSVIRHRRKMAGIKLGLFIACLLVAMAMCTHAEGAYNYNVSIIDPNKVIPIGEDVTLNAYVSYEGKPISEYPCIIAFYDYVDNSTLVSSREYTDELGQIYYSERLSDLFLYTNNYTYSISCSNTTEIGSIYADVGSTPNWFLNIFVYANDNPDWLVLFGVFGMLLVGFGIYTITNVVSE